MKRYQDWAKREYGEKQFPFALVPAGILIVLIVPFLIILASNASMPGCNYRDSRWAHSIS